MFGFKLCLDSTLSCGRRRYFSLLPFFWYNLLFSFITDILDFWLAIGTDRVVVMSLVAQWVDFVSIGKRIATTVAVFMEIASKFSFPLMCSCSKIAFIAGMKWIFRASLSWRVFPSWIDQEPVSEWVAFRMLLLLLGVSVPAMLWAWLSAEA